MVSEKIYEESLAEVRRIRKTLAFNTVTVNMEKLDPDTKAAIITALSEVISRREKEIKNVVTGVEVV